MLSFCKYMFLPKCMFVQDQLSEAEWVCSWLLYILLMVYLFPYQSHDVFGTMTFQKKKKQQKKQDIIKCCID